MFCSRCRTEREPGLRACPGCGRRIGEAVTAVAFSRLDRHLQTLATLWIVVGGLFLIPAIGLMVFGRAAHFVVYGREPLPGLFPLLLLVAGGSLGILGAGGVCLGVGLMQRQAWARVAGIILGVLALFHPPLGTALGVYTLWVLLADEGGDEYQYLTGAG